MQKDRRQRVREAIETIEALMEGDQMQEACYQISHWYRQDRGIQVPPSREGLETISTKWAEMYRCRPPEGLWVPVLVGSAMVADSIPGAAKIEQAVKDLRQSRARGPSDMQVAYLKGWLS